MIGGFFIMMMKKIVLTITIISILFACKGPEIKNGEGKTQINKYAAGFEISEIEEGYILKVKNRFGSEKDDTDDYLLSSSSESESSNNVIIHIPVSKVVCLSTTHCAFISALGRNSSIKGISSPEYVYDDEIQKMISNGDIYDVGYDNQINYEKIISINPDVVFAFGVDNASAANFQKLSDAGIPVIFVNDYVESTPLGRTEWIKFFGCFYDRLDFATEYFDSVETKYNSVKNNIPQSESKPKVLVSLPWKGTWWVPGGDSYFSNFIKDAGAEYIFDDNDKSESISLSIEQVFAAALAADFWLHPNNADSRKDILSVDSRMNKFEPFEKAKIYNNNKRKNRYGGNDFWESGIIHPDIILSDLKSIFYPDSTSSQNLFYYKKID
ncbi:MAG: ABC transporter substrate-binding protein [Bacteroidales bacterium]|nr:ABC transporter substrate-binding protein [Bacteroidales bacterium]